MCGICGVVGPRDSRASSVQLASMLTAMGHRGPDGSGTVERMGVAAGMVRLALLDLSERGQQPMWSPDRKVAILFNGEMYNYRSERRRIGDQFPFRTETDTEVALALYLERGAAFAEQLRGMFAVALLDWREGGDAAPPKVLLARDRFGIKPLYVAEARGGQLAFASEIKGLLASGMPAPTVDREGLASFLRHGFVGQPGSIVDGVRMLRAGTVEIFEAGSVARKLRFGVLPEAVARAESLSEAAARLRPVLEESVALHAFADAPVGAFLSGGVDSSGIVALMLRHTPRLRTYSLGWAEAGADDETLEAEATARRLGCEHTSIRVSGLEVAEVLARFARDLDQPSVDGLNTWFISRVAARDVKGVLSGLGGDEWFSGYPVVSRMVRFSTSPRSVLAGIGGRAAGALAVPLAGGRLGMRLEEWSSYRAPLALWLRSHSVYSDYEVAQLLGGRSRETGEERISRALVEDRVEVATETVPSLACRLDSGVYMRSQLLRDSDATSMAHSLELRVPFVDADVVAFARSCDDRYKITPSGDGSVYGKSGAKRVLIEALRDVLPPGIEGRPKRGFSMPYERWMQGPLREIAMDTTSGDSVRSRGLLQPRAVEAVRREVERSAPSAAYPKLWSLMILELWCREVLDPVRAGGAQ